MCLKDQNSMKMYPLGNVARVGSGLSAEGHAGSATGGRIEIRKSGEDILAGATGLEPATFGVTGQQFSLNIQDAFQLLKRRNEPQTPGSVGTRSTVNQR